VLAIEAEKMASAHYQTAANYLQENLNLLADTSSEANLKTDHSGISTMLC